MKRTYIKPDWQLIFFVFGRWSVCLWICFVYARQTGVLCCCFWHAAKRFSFTFSLHMSPTLSFISFIFFHKPHFHRYSLLCFTVATNSGTRHLMGFQFYLNHKPYFHLFLLKLLIDTILSPKMLEREKEKKKTILCRKDSDQY